MSLGVASKAWRDSLLKEVKVPELSQAFDINKYYVLATQVFNLAEEADMQNHYAHAYIKYKLYLGLAKEVIMKHNYYKHYVQKRKEFNKQYAVAVDRLEVLVKRMDEHVENHAAEMKAAEAERLRLRQVELAKERAAVLKEQQRLAATIAARASADAAAARAAEEASRALAKQKELERIAEIERNEKAALLASTNAQDDVNNIQNDLFGDNNSNKPPSSSSTTDMTALYKHLDGRQEVVKIVKIHSEIEGGGYTIFIPSLNRERMTEQHRLIFNQETINVPPSQSNGNDLLGIGSDNNNNNNNGSGGTLSQLDTNKVNEENGGLSTEDFNFLSNDNETTTNNNMTSNLGGGRSYPGVPHPSWMPESSGQAHKVTIPSAPPPPSSSLFSPTKSTIVTGTLLPDENDVSNQNKNNTPTSPVVTGTLLPDENNTQPIASAPPAYDSESFSDSLNNDVIAAVGAGAGTASMSNPFANDPLPAYRTAPNPSPSPAVVPTPPVVLKPLNTTPVRPPVAQAPLPKPTPPAPKPSVPTSSKKTKQPMPYGEEEEEESLADMLAAAASAASQPIIAAPAPKPPVQSSSSASPSPPFSSARSLSMKYNDYGAVFTSRQLKAETERQWQEMLRTGRAHIDYLGTYQGIRQGAGDSTNGCTVIAPLIGYRHLKWTNPKLPNSHIEHVIDKDCPPILSQIRRKFSLPNGSFVVPADVHDYLFEQKLLEESLFGGVHGGNVLDDDHIGSMITSLEEFKHKAAVCFFFKEHVVAILKDQNGQYELVDSLPDPAAGVGVRLNCKDSSVLRVCLAWYCMKKFSASNLDHIDTSPWDDMTAELDPRIFQGHVWHSGKD